MTAGTGARRLVHAALLLGALVAPLEGASAADVTFKKAPVTIIGTNGQSHTFTLELALDNDQRAHGLMFRREMAPDHGMLFDFGETRSVMMWMKNTYLPLDMLFVAKDGKVETVRENAVPQSEAIIDSGVPVAYVIELNAGTTKRLAITPGAHLQLPPDLPKANPDQP